MKFLFVLAILMLYITSILLSLWCMAGFALSLFFTPSELWYQIRFYLLPAPFIMWFIRFIIDKNLIPFLDFENEENK